MTSENKILSLTATARNWRFSGGRQFSISKSTSSVNIKSFLTANKTLPMKFDPITKDIYTDKDEFVKTMNCPYKMNWDNLEVINSTSRKCTNCEHLIVETSDLTDENLVKMVKQNPNICLKIDLNQQNIKIISNGILGQK